MFCADICGKYFGLLSSAVVCSRFKPSGRIIGTAFSVGAFDEAASGCVSTLLTSSPPPSVCATALAFGGGPPWIASNVLCHAGGGAFGGMIPSPTFSFEPPGDCALGLKGARLRSGYIPRHRLCMSGQCSHHPLGIAFGTLGGVSETISASGVDRAILRPLHCLPLYSSFNGLPRNSLHLW